MKIGIALAQSSWPDGGTSSLAEIVEYGLQAEACGFDSLWANDHFFIDLDDGRRLPQGADPLTLLAYLAGRTTRVELGTLVACAPFRAPGQLAREARALAELSGGRFLLGLGCGWHRQELDAFGIPSDRLVSRFGEYVESLVPLLRGDRVDYEGRYVTLSGAEVLGGETPSLWIAAAGPRMLALTARHADGWHHPGPWERFGDHLATVREAAARPLSVGTEAIALVVAPDEGARLLAGHPPDDDVVVGADSLRALVAAHREAGSDHLVLHLSGGLWSSHGAGQLALAAEALGLVSPAAGRFPSR
jgi:alkanesulfonate monooxygenase SsuD/methylene tetrahydromethanopterin reductase-like flavin-dependent oxidoreductase (luciferase family)